MSYSVKDTNWEALACKVCAIDNKYFEDEYAQSICQEKVKKDVIIKRGYWARVQAVRSIIQNFSKTEGNKQIISFGAGYDTTYFQFKKDLDQTLFVEVDLQEVIDKKVYLLFKFNLIEKSDLIMNVLKKDNYVPKKGSDHYKLFGCDITDTQKLKQKLQQNGIDFEQNFLFRKPTFIFAECVLTYIDPELVDNLIQQLSNTFTHLKFVTYEMYNPHDGFGKMMVKNFQVALCWVSTNIPKKVIKLIDTSQEISSRQISMTCLNFTIIIVIKKKERELKKQTFWTNLKNGIQLCSITFFWLLKNCLRANNLLNIYDQFKYILSKYYILNIFCQYGNKMDNLLKIKNFCETLNSKYHINSDPVQFIMDNVFVFYQMNQIKFESPQKSKVYEEARHSTVSFLKTQQRSSQGVSNHKESGISNFDDDMNYLSPLRDEDNLPPSNDQSGDSIRKQKNSDLLKSIDINLSNKKENQCQMVDRIQRNSVIFNPTLTPAKNTTSLQTIHSDSENELDSSFQELQENISRDIITCLKIKIAKLKETEFLDKTSTEELSGKLEQFHNVDNVSKLLNLKLFKNQVSNVLSQEEKVYKKGLQKDLTCKPYHIYHPLFDQKATEKSTMLQESSQQNHVQLIIGGISHPVYHYYIQQNDYIRCLTLRNSILYAHELVKDEKLTPQLSVDFRDASLFMSDLGSVMGTYVKLNYKNPFVLDYQDLIMFNDVAGFIITDRTDLQVKITLIRKYERQQLFFEYQTLWLQFNAYNPIINIKSQKQNILGQLNLSYEIYIGLDNDSQNIFVFTNDKEQKYNFQKFNSFEKKGENIQPGINTLSDPISMEKPSAHVCLSKLDVLQSKFAPREVKVADQSFVSFDRNIFQVCQDQIEIELTKE